MVGLLSGEARYEVKLISDINPNCKGFVVPTVYVVKMIMKMLGVVHAICFLIESRAASRWRC
jgi:hypothetical protein